MAASLEAVTADYLPLRAELRAFYPDECHGVCKLAAQMTVERTNMSLMTLRSLVRGSLHVAMA